MNYCDGLIEILQVFQESCVNITVRLTIPIPAHEFIQDNVYLVMNDPLTFFYLAIHQTPETFNLIGICAIGGFKFLHSLQWYVYSPLFANKNKLPNSPNVFVYPLSRVLLGCATVSPFCACLRFLISPFKYLFAPYQIPRCSVPGTAVIFSFLTEKAFTNFNITGFQRNT